MASKAITPKKPRRIYPEGSSDARKREINNLSDLSAYAYGFSDQRPRATYWIIQAGMLLICLASCVRIVHHA